MFRSGLKIKTINFKFNQLETNNTCIFKITGKDTLIPLNSVITFYSVSRF